LAMKRCVLLKKQKPAICDRAKYIATPNKKS